MKLTSQVCTFQQAQKLKELGITQNGNFLIDAPNNVFFNDGESYLNAKHIYTAFTVAELYAMLLCDASEKSGYNTAWINGMFNVLYKRIPFKEFTNQAEALAYVLILLIEKGFTMPEMCNDRLLNA